MLVIRKHSIRAKRYRDLARAVARKHCGYTSADIDVFFRQLQVYGYADVNGEEGNPGRREFVGSSVRFRSQWAIRPKNSAQDIL